MLLVARLPGERSMRWMGRGERGGVGMKVRGPVRLDWKRDIKGEVLTVLGTVLWVVGEGVVRVLVGWEGIVSVLVDWNGMVSASVGELMAGIDALV